MSTDHLDTDSLYSLRETIANLKDLESRLISRLNETDHLPAKELSQLLSVERLLVRTIDSAISVEEKLGRMIDASKIQYYLNLFKTMIEKYIKDDLERARFLAEIEQELNKNQEQ